MTALSADTGHLGEGPQLPRDIGAGRLEGDLGHALGFELLDSGAQRVGFTRERVLLDQITSDDIPINIVHEREVSLVSMNVTHRGIECLNAGDPFLAALQLFHLGPSRRRAVVGAVEHHRGATLGGFDHAG